MTLKIKSQVNREIEMQLIRNTLLVSIAMFALASVASNAQTPEASCAKLMPADKLQAAIGKGMKTADAEIEKSGKVSCAWMRRAPDPFATVSIEYYDKKAIAATTPDNAGSADDLFERMITPHEDRTKSKREAIAGVGKRAVLVPADPQRLVVIERDGAVVRVVMNGASKAQAIAVAKAIAAP
jgi:hypothetical protein